VSYCCGLKQRSSTIGEYWRPSYHVQTYQWSNHMTSIVVRRRPILIYVVLGRSPSAVRSSTSCRCISTPDCNGLLDVPVFVAGDVSLRLERADESNARHSSERLASFSLPSRVQLVATRDCGGWLDVVAIRSDLTSAVVKVIDQGFSDLRLLQWNSHLDRPAPVYGQVTVRLRRGIDSIDLVDTFHQSALVDSFDCETGDATANSMHSYKNIYF